MGRCAGQTIGIVSLFAAGVISISRITDEIPMNIDHTIWNKTDQTTAKLEFGMILNRIPCYWERPRDERVRQLPRYRLKKTSTPLDGTSVFENNDT